MTTSVLEPRAPLLFRYPGGKHYAIEILRPFWDAVPHAEYREPFAGGASVFFNKPQAEINWLNDLDHELITTMQQIADPISRQGLIQRVSSEEASPERWKEVRHFQPQNEIDVAFKYFYLNRTSFSGKLISPAWGYRDKRSLPPHRWHERIDPCGVKLNGSKFTNLDFADVIQSPSESDVLMYVDPPYYLPPKNKHYRHGFDKADHVRLSENLKTTPHKFFLTYEDTPEVRELYSWAYIYPVNFFYRVGNSAQQGGSRRQGFELVITNYEMSVFNVG